MPETPGSPARGHLLVAAPFPLTLRNFVPTGLCGALEERLGLRAEFISPYPQPWFEDPGGHRFPNAPVAALEGGAGVPWPAGVTLLDRALKSVHLTGFALEYPDGSLQNLELSRRRSAQRVVAGLLTRLAPRNSSARAFLRRLNALYRPSRPEVRAVFDRLDPRLVLVASPGHYWLDHFVLDEARRRGIPSVCVVLSWDNLYSRGPMCRRPDYLLVWSEEMRRQAVEVHQFPAERIRTVGALQFLFYGDPVTPSELHAVRRGLSLAPEEPYLAYVCGARTARYDVEDVIELVRRLRESPYRDLPVVVRPHPQGSRTAYESLLEHGVRLDRSPDLTDARTRPDAIDVGAVRHMMALLAGARFVVSSWGTTALLEACIVDTPSVQLRWMDALPRAAPDEVQLVRDFQRYIHMRAFDATGARPYSDHPSDLVATLADLERARPEYARRRADAVSRLTTLPLGGVVERVTEAVAGLPEVGAPALARAGAAG